MQRELGACALDKNAERSLELIDTRLAAASTAVVGDDPHNEFIAAVHR